MTFNPETQIQFSDKDVVNISEWVPNGESNPHNVRPFLFHDHGFVLCVVFSDTLQDAIDEAVDEGHLTRYAVSDEGLKTDYDADDDRLSYVGNDGAVHDLENLGVVELENPSLFGDK